MRESNNSFKDLEAMWEAGLPPELETRVSSQTNGLSVFGRVVELFVPNALQAVASMVGATSVVQNQAGGSPSGQQAAILDRSVDSFGSNPLSGRRPAPEEWPDWRIPPGRSGKPGVER